MNTDIYNCSQIPVQDHMNQIKVHMNPFLVHTLDMQIETIFGSRTTERILLHIFHYGDIHARGIARDYGSVVSPFVRQLNRLENVGILVSREVGRTRLYQFNPKSPYVTPLKKLVEITYERIPLSEREKIFHTRKRPRRKGKPVL